MHSYQHLPCHVTGLAAQLAEAEADEGNIPTDESPIAHILAYALGAEAGGIVGALLQGAEDALFLHHQNKGGPDLAPMVTADVGRRLTAARLLQGIERAASRKAADELRVAEAIGRETAERAHKVAAFAGELVAFVGCSHAEETNLRNLRVQIRALGADELTYPLLSIADRQIERLDATRPKPEDEPEPPTNGGPKSGVRRDGRAKRRGRK